MYVIIMKVSWNHEQVMKFMTKSNVWLNNWFLTFSWLLDDVWLHVWRLLMSRMGLLMISLNCCSRKGFTLSCRNWWKCYKNKTKDLWTLPVLAPDTTEVLAAFSFLSSPNSSISSWLGFTAGAFSDSDLRGLITWRTPPTWEVEKIYLILWEQI